MSSKSVYRFLVKLAPCNGQDPSDYHLNSSLACMIMMDREENLTVASALRYLLEENFTACFLSRVCNRALKDVKEKETAVQLNYGDSWKTYVNSKGQSSVKSFKHIGVFLHLGELYEDPNLPFVVTSPSDRFFSHVEARSYDEKQPMPLYICTGDVVFASRSCPSREASIELDVEPNEKGYFTNGLFDGERKPYLHAKKKTNKKATKVTEENKKYSKESSLNKKSSTQESDSETEESSQVKTTKKSSSSTKKPAKENRKSRKKVETKDSGLEAEKSPNSKKRKQEFDSETEASSKTAKKAVPTSKKRPSTGAGKAAKKKRKSGV
mmetsp:Transcript_27774/g.42029  ORF Transcript_27774/g.42029 Transcript_27774/m.42029 type:complete len:324 (-) Transcript_27774:460-1431(-)